MNPLDKIKAAQERHFKVLKQFNQLDRLVGDFYLELFQVPEHFKITQVDNYFVLPDVGKRFFELEFRNYHIKVMSNNLVLTKAWLEFKYQPWNGGTIPHLADVEVAVSLYVNGSWTGSIYVLDDKPMIHLFQKDEDYSQERLLELLLEDL